MKTNTAPLLAAAALVAGCSLFRWSGYRDSKPDADGGWSAADLLISTGPARERRPVLEAPERPADTLYYTDLGPDAIDVSGYPAQQKYNYTVFRRQCSRCHALARAINSPVQSRTYWHFHLIRMSLHSRLHHEGPIPRDQVKTILDFLEYDAQVRKVRDKKRFEEQTEELKRRFDPILKTRLERMQNSGQPLLPTSSDY